MARVPGSMNVALRGLQILAGTAPAEAPMVAQQMQTRAASNATNNHAGADAQKPDLSARPAFTFFNKDGPGKTLVIMGTKGDYKVIPQVEKKGPREGWDDDIH